MKTLASTDLTGNLILAALLLVAGAAFIFLRTRRSEAAGLDRCAPWITLCAGPVISAVFCGVGWLLDSTESHLALSDALHLLPPMLLIGSLAGVFVTGIVVLTARGRTSITDQNVTDSPRSTENDC